MVYILRILAIHVTVDCPQDQYPDVFRFTASVFPSEDDDVVTSPYNAMLSLSKLVEFADCVLPIENQALAEIVGRVDGRTGAAGGGGVVPAAGVMPEAGRGELGIEPHCAKQLQGLFLL